MTEAKAWLKIYQRFAELIYEYQIKPIEKHLWMG